MKRLFNVLALMPLLFAAASCNEKNPEDVNDVTPLSADTDIRSIYVYAENPDRTDDFDVSANDTGDAFIFTTRALANTEKPYDLTKVHIDVEVHKDARVNVTKDQVIDFSDGKTFDLVIEAQNGDKVTCNCSVVVSPAYELIPEYETTVTEVWTKTGAELQLKFPGTCRDIAVYGDYFLMLDNVIDNNAEAKIKVYNSLTGEFIKNIGQYDARFLPGDAPCGMQNFPRSYSWTLECDEAGHIALGRLNSGGAGFFLDVWENIDAAPVVPVIIAADKVPDCAGRRMQLMGDVLSGKAQILLTTANYYGAFPVQPGTYTVIDMNDGVPAEPQVCFCAFAWHSGIVQKAGLNDQTLYVTGSYESTYPSDPVDQWDKVHSTRFAINDPALSEPLEMNASNFLYRVLDAKVFELNGLRYYLTLQQGYSTATGEIVARLYNISGSTKMNMKPGNEGYDRFLVWESATHFNDANGDCRFGNVDVQVDEESKSARMYVFYPGNASAKVSCMKIQLGAEIK